MDKYKKINFRWQHSWRNLNYEDGLIDLPRPRDFSLRSCHIHNNAEKLKSADAEGLTVKTQPKWRTTLAYDEVDQETGAITGEFLMHNTDDLIAGNARKIKAVNEFCDFYNPLYKRKEVSLLLHTFTRINFSKSTLRRTIDSIKYRYKKIGRPLRGYLWTLEVSKNLHAHYHMATAIDRLEVDSMPDELKCEGLWGQRTGVEFVKRSLRYYLSAYFAKNRWRIQGQRQYGKSRSYV